MMSVLSRFSVVVGGGGGVIVVVVVDVVMLSTFILPDKLRTKEDESNVRLNKD